MGDFPARPRLAARRAVPDIDLRADADRLLSDIPALPRVFLCWRRGRSGKPEAWPARRGRRTRKTMAGLARLCVRVLPRDSHPGLRPPQLGGGFRYAAAAVANQLRPRICDLQRRN